MPAQFTIPKTEKSLKLRHPTTSLTRRALKMTSGSGSVESYDAQLNLLRLCLVEFDGKSLSFGDLEGDAIDEVLDSKELAFAMQGLEYISGPDQEESEDFLDSMTIVEGG